MSLEEELTVEMKGFAFMSERIAALRKKNKNFHRNMIDKFLKIDEKYPVYEKGDNSGPDNGHPEVTEEDNDE